MIDSAVKNEKMSSTYVMQINKVRINKLKSEYHSAWVNNMSEGSNKTKSNKEN